MAVSSWDYQNTNIQASGINPLNIYRTTNHEHKIIGGNMNVNELPQSS